MHPYGVVKFERCIQARAFEDSLITRRQILDSSKLKEFADKNSRKLSKWLENTVGKGENSCYEQFLLFPQCFQKACFPGASKQKASLYGNGLTLFHTSP